MSNTLQSLVDLLYINADEAHSDELLTTIAEKMVSALTPEEQAVLHEVTEKLHDAKTGEDFADRYDYVTSADLNDLFKRYIWDNSDEWASEMYSVTDGIMTNMDMLESDALKRFILTLNKKDKQDGRFQNVHVNGES